eukprot:3743582-Pyramimonas_sp.AAC.1
MIARRLASRSPPPGTPGRTRHARAQQNDRGGRMGMKMLHPSLGLKGRTSGDLHRHLAHRNEAEARWRPATRGWDE